MNKPAEKKIPASLFEQALSHVHESVCITDSELTAPGPRILFVNQAFERLTGYARGDVLGRDPRLLQGPMTSRDLLDTLRNSLSAGESFNGETINYRSDGTPFVMQWTIDPVAVDDETYFVAFQRDVTDQRLHERATAAVAALDQAAIEIATRSGPGDLIESYAAALQQAVAAYCLAGRVTVLLEDSTGVRTIAGGGAEPDDKGDREDATYEPPRVARQVRETIEGHTFNAEIRINGLEGASIALVAHPALSRVVTAAAHGFNSLAALEQRRREIAAVQRVLMPPRTFSIAGFRLLSHYSPSRHSESAGGDWFDAIELADTVRLVVGDVVGKGLQAAAEMGLVRAHLRALLLAGTPLEEVVEVTDTFSRKERMMATAIFVDVERANGLMTIASAGHPAPLVARGDHVNVTHIHVSPPLGAFRSAVPLPAPTQDILQPDATLVLYTDGAFESDRHGLAAGPETLAEQLTGCDDIDDVWNRLTRLDGGRDDDVAILLAKRLLPT